MGAGEKLLGVAGVGALNVANAIKPFSRSGLGATMSFAAGWPTSELPLHLMGSQMATTAGLVARGALQSRTGRIGLAVSALTWVGLVGLHRETRKAEALFNSVVGRIDEAPAVSGLRSLVLPGLGETDFRIHRDIAYGNAGRDNLLDVWRRADLSSDAKAPVLLQVHGGGWVFGSKNGQAITLMNHMASRGWVCVAINYRLSPRATWPDHIVDVKRAIMWIRKNIAQYGGDPSFIAITGGSAGGHLAALAALSANDPAFQPGFEDADTTIQAAVPYYGVYNLTDPDVMPPDTTRFLESKVMKVEVAGAPGLWAAASPIERVIPEAPPFLVIHGSNDSLVPVEQAQTFVDALRVRSRNPVLYAEVPGAQHAFDTLATPRTRVTAGAVCRFLNAVHSGEIGVDGRCHVES